jgi:3-oxoadipate enol-lactonase
MAHLRSDDADVWWDSTGRGTPVLLINGLSSPSATWFRLTPLLADHHTVLTFDNPGTGQTTTSNPNFTMTTMSAAAAAVIRTADLGPAHVLGLSMGGLVAQDLALEHPDAVASLTLASTHAGGPHMTQNQATLDAVTRAAQLPPQERTQLLATMAFAESTPQDRIAEDLSVRAAHPTAPQGYAAQLAATSTWERLADLDRIACPTLILHGAADRMVSPENARTLLNHIPGARLVLLQACGHSVFTDQPEQASRAVLDFLAPLTPTSP